MMKIRFVALLVLGVMACGIAIPLQPVQAQVRCEDIQVRVYRQPRPGKYEFLANVLVKVCDGQRGVTRDRPGVRGTVEFKNVCCRSHYAEAFINGRWIRSSRSERIGRVLRLDVVVP